MAMVPEESDSFQSRFKKKFISSEQLSVSDIQIVKSIILNLQIYKKKIWNHFPYQLLPSVVHLCDVLLLPFLQIKDIHSICPSTSTSIKILWDKRIWKVKIPIKAMEAFSTSLHSPINISLQVKGPEPSKILLHNYIIIQEQNFVELWKDLWKVKAEMVQDRQVLWVSKLQIWIRIGPMSPKVIIYHGCRTQLLQNRTVTWIQPCKFFNVLNLNSGLARRIY